MDDSKGRGPMGKPLAHLEDFLIDRLVEEAANRLSRRLLSDVADHPGTSLFLSTHLGSMRIGATRAAIFGQTGTQGATA
jgi:hypothetical protein